MTKQDIKKLECFKSFNPIQKKMVLKHRNIETINHELELIKNIGYDLWLSRFGGYYLNQLIVYEVIHTSL